MSLFQAREWWSCPSSRSEEYDKGGLVVADLLGRGEDVLVVASFQGYLRIYSPHFGGEPAATASDGHISMPPHADAAAGVEDLLLEEQLQSGVLSIAVGRFSSTVPGLTLAVLHPHTLAVYSVVSSSGGADLAPAQGRKAALFYRLNRLYEHAFATSVGSHFAAANMAYGPFGQTGGDGSTVVTYKDSIAVQSMDGQLAVFEQERFAFRRNLNAGGGSGPAGTTALTYLLPGPLVYVPKTDSLATVNSEMRLDSFRYSTLLSAWSSDTGGSTGALPTAAPTAISTTAATADAAAGRKLRPDWSVNVGEHAHHMCIGRVTQAATAAAIAAGATTAVAALGKGVAGGQATWGPCEIALAGERSFIVVRDAGPAYAGTGADGAATSGPSSTALAVRTQRKLDYSPACMAVYARGAAASASSLQTLFPDAYGSPMGPPTNGATGYTHGTIIVSHTGVCHIYKADTLLWAARLPPNFTQAVRVGASVDAVGPVAVGVGRFAGMPGMLVFLSSRGDVSVCFCGTDPPVGSLTGGETVRDLDYAAMDREHRALLGKIRDMQAAASASDRAQSAAPQPYALTVAVPACLDIRESTGSGAGHLRAQSMHMRDAMMSSSKEAEGAFDSEKVDYSHIEWEDDGEGPGPHNMTVTATLTVSTKGPTLSEVRLTVCTPPWVILPKGQRSITLTGVAVSPGKPFSVKIPFAASRRGVPTDDTSATIAATFTTDAGELRTATCTLELPLAMAVSLAPPVKTATFKLTLDVNRPELPPLTELFGDCFQQPPSALPPTDVFNRIVSTATAVLTFAYRSGADVTILASKAGGRFRIQAGSLEALALVTTQLCTRLRRYFSLGGPGYSNRDSAIELTYAEPLPLADFFGVIQAHYDLRRKLLQAYSDLNDRAHEYRLVAKRLLVRWKDKSPQPLNGLDRLLDVAQENVMNAGNTVAQLQDDVVAAGNKLSCTVCLMLQLTRLRFALTDASFTALARYLSPVVVDTLEVGWEEMTDTALTHLLKALTSGAATSDAGAVAQALHMPEDTARLRSHLTLLLDRLSKAQSSAIEEALASAK